MKRVIGLAMTCTAMFVAPSDAATATSLPSPLDDIGVDQRLGERLPLDVPLLDEAGVTVRLGAYFRGRPMIFTLVYFECPMLCTLTLNQLTRSLSALPESAGETFDVVAVSIDPRETPALAAAKKGNYLRAYRRPSAGDGWHLLTGDAPAIAAIAHAAGFRYRWDAKDQLFAHASAVMVVTPDGRLSRYFLGVDYPPTELQAALRVAAGGSVGRAADPVYFYCLKYDPETGRYGLLIGRTLRALAIASLVGVIGLCASLQWFVTRRTRRSVGGGR